MAMVEIPRQIVDPTIPEPKWPGQVYPWVDPTITPDGQRVPDYIPLVDSSPPEGKFVWLPAYKDLPVLEDLMLTDHQQFNWLIDGTGRPLPKSGYPILPPEYQVNGDMDANGGDGVKRSEFELVRRFDQAKVYHSKGKFYVPTWIIPNYAQYSQAFNVKERRDYLKWGRKSLNHLVPPYQVLFDSKMQHPTSTFCYSAVRVDTNEAIRNRRKFYCNNWRSRVEKMAFMVEFAAAEKHQIIIVEQTPLASLMMQRLMFGANLTSVAGWSCLATILISYQGHRVRWPSLYLCPALLTVYCFLIYRTQVRNDPCWRYSFWTTWVNDPTEHEVFEHINVLPDLLRQEKMTFMQLEGNTKRRRMMGVFSLVAISSSFSALIHRMQYREFDLSAQLVEDIFRVGECGGDSISNTAGGLFNKFLFSPREMSFVQRLFLWASAFLIYSFIGPPLLLRIKKRFDWKTRSKLLVNQVAFRAMKGERRYMRLIQPMYWIYRWSYPRDEMGARDRWYLSQRYRHTPGSHQFYY